MTCVAIFDLDKTLIPFDCDEAWGQHMHSQGYTSPDFLVRQQAFFEQYDAGTLDIHEYQRFAMQATIEAGPMLAQQELANFVASSIKPRIAPQVVQLIDAHRRLGHRLLVITASNAFVSRAVVDALGIHDLLAIDLATNEAGWFTGDIQGTPSFREGKVERFEQWLRHQGLERESLELHFYSDSINDLPLLSYVDHPVATNPSAALRQHALQQGWRVMDLFSD